jgi:colicin import membrane protein
MPPRKVVVRGGWRAIGGSVLLHSAIVAAAVYGWFTWKHRPPEPQTLAIEASVVDERVLKGVAPPPDPAPEPPPQEPEPEPPPPEEQGPPAPDPAEVERRQEEERLAAEKAEQEKQAKEEELQLDAEKKEAEKKEAEKKEAEKEAAARAAAEKAAAEKAAADKKAAEKKRQEEAAAARKAAEEKARLARQEELNRALEAEERTNAARNSVDAERWKATIGAKIERAWKRPPTAVAGVQCIVVVNQVPGGEVTKVVVESCDPDNESLKESVANAAHDASPLPDPPQGVPFERSLRLKFAPQ